MKQLEVLKKAFANDATKPANRRKYFYGVGFPTIWELEVNPETIMLVYSQYIELSMYFRLHR